MQPSLTTARDIPILVTSVASSSERRITPSWSIAHLKTKLEPVTGISPSSQKLTLRLPDQPKEITIEADNEDAVEVGRWPLVAHAEIKVYDLSQALITFSSSASGRAPSRYLNVPMSCADHGGELLPILLSPCTSGCRCYVNAVDF